MAWTWTMVSPLLMAKCRISLGTIKKPPTFIVCSLLSSKLSPIPTRKVAFSTVTFSSVGCQCAGILDPSAHRIRRTKGAAFCIHVSRDRCEIASLNYRCPFQIAEAHDLVRLAAFLSLLAESRHRGRSD